jgi:N-acetylmuramoyl-L-alanine amidase
MVKQHDIFIRYSPNHNERPAEAVSLLVIHYTGMPNENAALEWLCNAESKVSAHYFITESGEICQLVEEDRRAWHAGVSHWAGRDNINDVSIGIELVNKGHEWGYSSFPEAQINALIWLAKDIMWRHEVTAQAVVGHSDIAPLRKQDPGELFPWEVLAKENIGLWHDINDDGLNSIPLPLSAAAKRQLKAFGYGIDEMDEAQQRAVITAFQRRFRSSLINGEWDTACQQRLDALIVKL